MKLKEAYGSENYLVILQQNHVLVKEGLMIARAPETDSKGPDHHSSCGITMKTGQYEVYTEIGEDNAEKADD